MAAKNSGRNWIFTLNNYNDTEVEALKRMVESETAIFICFGYERGTQGTPHLQGYVEFGSVKTLSAIKRIPGLMRSHLETRSPKSTKLKTVSYCAKELAVRLHTLGAISSKVLEAYRSGYEEIFIEELSNEEETIPSKFTLKKGTLCRVPSKFEGIERPATEGYESFDKARKMIETEAYAEWRDVVKRCMPEHEYVPNPTFSEDNNVALKFNYDQATEYYKMYYYESGDWEHNQKKAIAKLEGKGKLGNQGKRNDLEGIKEMVRNGASLSEVIEAAESYQAVCFGRIMIANRAPTKRPKPKVFWVTGPSGYGKTTLAFDSVIGRVWTSSKDCQWFDGYDGQETVIFDDFRPDNIRAEFLFRLMDGNPLLVPIKGGFVEWKPKYIWVTSIKHPSHCYSEVEDSNNVQLLRRITKLITVTKPPDIVEEVTDDDEEYVKMMAKLSTMSDRYNVGEATNLEHTEESDMDFLTRSSK